MKLLYLVRHAKSSWDDPLQDDFDRPLNDRGRRDAPRMARRLLERDIHPYLMLSSPADRALSTCLLMAEVIGYPVINIKTDRRLYHASRQEILHVVHELNDDNNAVMIFSHNPGLTDFANSASVEEVTDNIPTCGVVGMRFSASSWKAISWHSGETQFFDFPKRKD